MAKLYVETPLIFSAALSQQIDRPVYLKLENTQPTGSFKLRGISNHVQHVAAQGGKHVVIASGGNAGIATAYSAYQLGIKATIFTVSGHTQAALKKFHDLECEIFDGGVLYDDCVMSLKKYLEEHTDAINIHPFDGEKVWEGHATMMHEIKEQLGVTPGAVISCVGGGGLVSGIALGMQDVGWSDVPLVAMETEGAHSFNKAVQAGEVVYMPEITSIAHTLAAKRVCEKVVQWSKDRQIISRVCSDAEAVEACALFLRDHNMLVEPSCGATLSAVYTNRLKEYLDQSDKVINGDTHTDINGEAKSPIVVIVCGGATITKEGLDKLIEQFGVDLKLKKQYPLPKWGQ